MLHHARNIRFACRASVDPFPGVDQQARAVTAGVLSRAGGGGEGARRPVGGVRTARAPAQTDLMGESCVVSRSCPIVPEPPATGRAGMSSSWPGRQPRCWDVLLRCSLRPRRAQSRRVVDGRPGARKLRLRAGSCGRESSAARLASPSARPVARELSVRSRSRPTRSRTARSCRSRHRWSSPTPRTTGSRTARGRTSSRHRCPSARGSRTSTSAWTSRAHRTITRSPG